MAYYRLGQSYPRIFQRKEYPNRRKKRETLVVPNLTNIITQTLNLQQSVSVVRVKSAVANNVLIVSQSVVHGTTYNLTASNFVTLIQNAGASRSTLAGNVLTLTQNATHDVTLGPNDSLSLNQTVSVELDLALGIRQTLNLSQTVVGQATKTRNVSSFVLLSQAATAQLVKSAEASNLLVVTHVARATNVLQPANILIISQSASVQKIITKNAFSNLILTQNIQRQVTFNRSANNVLVFPTVYYKPTGLPGNYFPVLNAVGTKINDGVVVLKVPSRTITFKKPIFTDTEAGSGKILLKRTIFGDTITYVRRSKLRKLKYHFIITREKALEFRDYVLNYLSDIMTLENWKGEIWYGFLLTNPQELTVKRFDEEYEIEFEFEGIQVN